MTREVQVFETLPGGCSRWQMSYPSHSSNLRNMKHWSLVSARRVSRGGIATAHTLRWLGGLCVDGKLVNSVKSMCQFSSELLQVAFLKKHLKYLQDWNSTVFAFFAKLFGGNFVTRWLETTINSNTFGMPLKWMHHFSLLWPPVFWVKIWRPARNSSRLELFGRSIFCSNGNERDF